MVWNRMAALAAVLTAGCYAQNPAPADNGTEAPAPADPVQTRYRETISGQPLSRPPDPFELLVTQASFPRGHLISCHRHTWPRYVYLQTGRLRVTIQESGQVKEFKAGDTVVEPIGQWHHGDVLEAVSLVAVEQVPPGAQNSTPWPPPPPAPSACPPLPK